MSKSISVILACKNKLTPETDKAGRSLRQLNAEANKTKRALNNMTNNGIKNFNNLAISCGKFAIAGMAMGAVFALKTGLSEAMDMQGYRAQLETATKDTKKASEIMRSAIEMANATPFEGGELVQGAAKFESMAMDSKKWLMLTGNMTGATGKNFDQGVEAIIDAQSGELERLKEFGLKKSMIQDKADAMFGKKKTINKKGQIIDQIKFNQALERIMIEKYSGGMDKLSKTLRGRWSTVTGIFKSGMATAMGITQEGLVIKGSILDKIIGKVEILGKKFEEMQANGTFEKLGKNLTLIYGKMEKVYNYIKANKDTIISIGITVGIIMGVVDAFIALSSFISACTVVAGIFNLTLGLCPVVWILAGLVAIGAGLFLLVKHFDDVSNACRKAWDWLHKFNAVEDTTVSVNAYQDNILAVKKKKANESEAKRLRNFVKNGRDVGKNANGTSNWRGGLTQINERGGEIIDLPKGSRVIPADKSAKMMSGTTINVTIANINGSTRDIAEQCGNIIASKIKSALPNQNKLEF